jgi:hemoglobin-like flavoprotein
VTQALEDLGRRHVAYGVIPDHYPIVGEALLHTLETALECAWTPTVKEGWTTIYAFVSTTMIRGAKIAMAEDLQVEGVVVAEGGKVRAA